LSIPHDHPPSQRYSAGRGGAPSISLARPGRQEIAPIYRHGADRRTARRVGPMVHRPRGAVVREPFACDRLPRAETGESGGERDRPRAL